MAGDTAQLLFPVDRGTTFELPKGGECRVVAVIILDRFSRQNLHHEVSIDDLCVRVRTHRKVCH